MTAPPKTAPAPGLWLKNVVIDLVVTAVIVVAALTGAAWTKWALLIYTPLLLLMKGIAHFADTAGAIQKKGSTAEPPAAFFHVLYAISVAGLAVAAWRFDDPIWTGLAVAWAVVWLLSALSVRRKTAPPTGASRKTASRKTASRKTASRKTASRKTASRK